jgi:tetratricopeptide (TPR) repeat protein
MRTEPNWLDFFEDRERLYAAYYLDFAERNARRDPEAYEQLEAESGNLLRVADWLGEHNEAEGILRLAGALWEESDFLHTRGFIQRALLLLEQAYQSARQLGDIRAEFTWLEAYAYAQGSNGKLTLARPLLEQALVLAEEIDEPKFRAKAQLEMGRLLMEVGHLDDAATRLKQALNDYRLGQDYAGEIETLIVLGNLLSLQGDSDGAVAYLGQGLTLVRAKQDRYGEVALRFALGYVGSLTRNWTLAVKHYELVIEMARAVGDRFLEARGLTNLGEAWLELGDVQQAISLLSEALDLQKMSDDVLTKAFTHFYLGKVYYVFNDPDRTLAQLSQVSIFRQIPNVVDIAAEAAWLEAECYLKKNNIDSARIALQNVLNLAPDRMTDIRQAAKSLLESIDKGG